MTPTTQGYCYAMEQISLENTQILTGYAQFSQEISGNHQFLFFRP